MANPPDAAEGEARERARAAFVARIPRFYSPWFHLAFPSLVGIVLIAVALSRIDRLRPVELLCPPIVFFLINGAEWLAHRSVLHRRLPLLGTLYDKHTPEHHRVYVRHDMAIRETREFRLVLLPAYAILIILLMALPITWTLRSLGLENDAALFFATAMFYIVSYEWLHLAYHLPPEGRVGRLALVRLLARHHTIHHSPELMQRWNFNGTFPIWDFLLGTIHRDSHN